MSTRNGALTVKIVRNNGTAPAGKVADAELHFGDGAGPLAGLKLIGFSVWERRGGGLNVTFPARQYAVNGERRSFALLRPAGGDLHGQEAVRDLIIEAYQLEADNAAVR